MSLGLSGRGTLQTHLQKQLNVVRLALYAVDLPVELAELPRLVAARCGGGGSLDGIGELHDCAYLG